MTISAYLRPYNKRSVYVLGCSEDLVRGNKLCLFKQDDGAQSCPSCLLYTPGYFIIQYKQSELNSGTCFYITQLQHLSNISISSSKTTNRLYM